MRIKIAFLVLLAGISSVSAQVELLPADFTLFDKSRGDYLAEWLQYIIPLSTNGDSNFPKAVPSESDPVYFLQRPLFGPPPPGVQTYFVPDDVYVCFPIVFFWGDNVDVPLPGSTVEQLRDGVNSIADVISGVFVTFDGIVHTNLQAYRTESPVFTMFFPSSDNFYSVILGHPFEGLVDPAVAAGYLLMLKPLPAGLHDVRLGATIGGANNFSFRRHFQIYSLTVGERLARQTEELAAMVGDSDLPANRKQPLLVSLNAAAASLESSNARAAINQLRAFQNKVRAQVESLDGALAEELSAFAQRLIDTAEARLRGP